MDQNAKQLIAEKLRSGANVLITVSNSPSVDQLSSAIGLNLMLSTLGKHSTSVFSGEIPNTMQFFEAEKRFDNSVDGLRDFIITLSKDKADKLRYKVEDEVVRIFITPFQGQITEKDLNFSQGDFNVDLVVALGVKKRDELDNAITAHGRILHDATIITITAGEGQQSDLGAVNWHDPNASSIAEMLVSISEALQGNILDAPMATAFLTGIVAATDRFSNDKTTPKVMTMSAQLMAAGANQQLIATNLQLDKPKSKKPEGAVDENESVDLHKGDKKKKPKPKKDKKANDGLSLQEIEKEFHAHEDQPTKEEGDEAKKDDPTLVAAPVPEELNLEELKPPAPQENNEPKTETKPEPEDPAIVALEDAISHDPAEAMRNIEDQLHTAQTAKASEVPSQADNKHTLLGGPTIPGPIPDSSDLPERGAPTEVQLPPSNEQPMMDHKNVIEPIHNQNSQIAGVKGQGPHETYLDEPTMGGTFNATSAQAHDAMEQAKHSGVNNEILSHGAPQQSASPQIPPSPPPPQMPQSDSVTPSIPQMPQPQTEDMLTQAREAVQNAVDATYNPANNPLQSIGSQPMPLGAEDSGLIHGNEQSQLSTPPPLPPPQSMAPQSPPPMPAPAQAPITPPPMPPNNQIPTPQTPQYPQNGVGQMFIPPNQQQQPPPQQQSNPFNQPTSQFPYQ